MGNDVRKIIDDIYNNENFYEKENLLIIMSQDASELEEIFKTFRTVGYTEGKILLRDYFNRVDKNNFDL